MLAYTICTKSYLAYCEVLAESLARHNKGLRLAVVLLDGDENLQLGDADVVLPSQLPFDSHAEFHRMAMIYDVVELATAVKPWAFRYFLGRGHDAVIYLDPDIEVFADLGELGPMASKHGIVLNPHTTKPLPTDNNIPSERDLLLAGTFNLGFLGVGASAHPFLEWWSDRLRRHCINDVANGYFVDQRWIDLVPSYFDHTLLKDPGYNVAYWNLPTRKFEREGDRYIVDGVPLKFFHYSGFSPNAEHLLTKHQGASPRILLSEHPALSKLCHDYARSLQRRGYARWTRTGYGYDCAGNGLRLDRRMRRVYREILLREEESGLPLSVPDPFTPEGAEHFVKWLNEPYSFRSGRVSKYLREVWVERSDLMGAFPDVEGADADRFVNWIREGGIVDPPVPEQLMSSRHDAVRTKARREGALQPGVNLYGYVFAESGTGQIGRSIVATLQAAKIPYAVVPFTETINRQNHTFTDSGSGVAIYDTNLICVNADQVPVFLDKVGADILYDHYNIGVWAWEVDDMPDWMAESAQHLDEVWGISNYTAAAVRNRVRVPVRAFPLPVVPAIPEKRARYELGLPEGFLFLFCFDFQSVFERKNPLAVISAYRRAFPRAGEALLCIKSVNGQLHRLDLERLRTAAAGRSDIVIIDGYRSAEEQLALMNACDAYVSLHRAEGFGLTVAEAMSLGKPVIVTAYSSTTEFTTSENSYPVPARVIQVPQGTPVYPPTAHWAEPDVSSAASMMRRVFERREEAQQIGERGRKDIAELHSPKARAARLTELFEMTRRTRSTVPRRKPPLATRVASSRRTVGTATGETAAEQRAAALILGPNPNLPSRLPWLARPLRRLMLRLIRNYWVHQLEIDRSLLESVKHSRESVRHEIHTMVDTVTRRVQEVDDEISASNRASHVEFQELAARVSRLEEGRRAADVLSHIGPLTAAADDPDDDGTERPPDGASRRANAVASTDATSRSSRRFDR